MSSTKPRLLVVSPTPSHPANQGNSARIFVLARELMSRGFVADIAYYQLEDLTPTQHADMNAFWNEVHPFVPSGRFIQSLPTTWGCDDWCSAAFAEFVEGLHAVRGYTAVLVNYVWMSRVLDGLHDVVKVIDTHDIFADRHLTSLAAGHVPQWFYTTRAEEDRGLSRADLVVGITANETAELSGRIKVPVKTVGHAGWPDFLFQQKTSETRVDFGYLGSANPWNVKSIQELDEILATDHSIEWLIAGTIVRRRLRFKSYPIELGIVDKVADFYSKVSCVVNPMIGGTGLKIKTVEALSFGVPVLGTRDAFVGITDTPPEYDWTSLREIVAAMQRYRDDAAFRDRLTRSCREIYVNYLSNVSAQVDVLCQSLRGES